VIASDIAFTARRGIGTNELLIAGLREEAARL
jgi:hypothetical protein